jgi:hypothetical protein
MMTGGLARRSTTMTTRRSLRHAKIHPYRTEYCLMFNGRMVVRSSDTAGKGREAVLG